MELSRLDRYCWRGVDGYNLLGRMALYSTSVWNDVSIHILNCVNADGIELENGVGDRNMFNCGKGIGITPRKAERSVMI